MDTKQVIVQYEAVNSGGSIWLSGEDFLNLEEEGWTVHWASRKGNSADHFIEASWKTLDELLTATGDREWALSEANPAEPALLCAKAGDNAADLIEEWVSITGRDPHAEGCSCCGSPHVFTTFDRDGNAIW